MTNFVRDTVCCLFLQVQEVLSVQGKHIRNRPLKGSLQLAKDSQLKLSARENVSANVYF